MLGTFIYLFLDLSFGFKNGSGETCLVKVSAPEFYLERAGEIIYGTPLTYLIPVPYTYRVVLFASVTEFFLSSLALRAYVAGGFTLSLTFGDPS